MRLVALLAALVLLVAPAFAQKPQQQAPQPPELQRPQRAGPQGGIATPRGWRRDAVASGTTYFRCAGASTCQDGDAVSYVVQPPGPIFTMDVFRDRQERVNQRLRSERGYRNIDMAVRDESRGDTIVYVADLDLTDAAGTDSAWISVYIARNQRHVTLISTAPTLAAARANIAGFQTALIDWLR